MIADSAGRAVAFALAPGQAHELPHAVPLLARLPDVPMWVVADRGYSSHAFREHVWSLGARPAIPTRRDEAPVACPAWIHNNGNRVECLREGAARRGDRLREDRLRLPRRPLHGSNHGLAQNRQRAGGPQSTLAPEIRTISAHFGSSAAMKRANSSGVLPTGSAPRSAYFSLISGCCSTFAISA